MLVHQSGIGTTGEAMRTGKPMVVVPIAHDSPDNARRIARLSIWRVPPRNKATTWLLTDALQRLIEDDCYARRAAAIVDRIRLKDGAGVSCNALEQL